MKYADDVEVVIGEGTVLDAATAISAIATGANYLVSPGFDRDVADCVIYIKFHIYLDV